jgi:hypothetical protein
MPSRALGRTQRVVLLCALALGVLAMHHVNAVGAVHETVATFAVDSPATAMTAGSLDATPQHPACPLCGGHDVLHVCLAVLCATTMILLALLAFLIFSSASTTAAATGPRGSPGTRHPPHGGGRAVLACLCVLRV